MQNYTYSSKLCNYLLNEEAEFDISELTVCFSDYSKEKVIRKECKEIWNSEEYSKDDHHNFSPILDRIHHRIRISEYENHGSSSSIKPVIQFITKVAAVLFIPLIILTSLIWDHGFLSGKDKMASSEIHVPRGTRTEFSLPDGTTGWLNSGSTLEFPVNFTGKYRTVTLKGEGYFNVKTDKSKPFRVISDDLEIIAHGTAFNIMSYDDFKKTEITLVEGNLEVKDKSKRHSPILSYLEPDNMLTYYKSTDHFLIRNVQTYRYTSWREGKLVFRNDPFDVVVKKLNNWYNVEIEIQDQQIKDYSYRATFVDETIEEVLKLLKLSAPIDYRILGRKIEPDGTIGKQRIILYYHP